MKDQPTVRVGQIVGAFGLKGQLKVEPLTDFFERFEKGAKLLLGDKWLEVESFAVHKGRPLIKLQGIEDMTAAEKLQWQFLEALADERPDLEEDEFLTSDLIGLDVVSTDGVDLGTVEDVLPMPAHDVLQVGSILIPVVKQFIVDIDLDAGRITVQLIPGMLPGEE